MALHRTATSGLVELVAQRLQKLPERADIFRDDMPPLFQAVISGDDFRLVPRRLRILIGHIRLLVAIPKGRLKLKC